MSETSVRARPLDAVERLDLAVRIWWAFMVVSVSVRRRPVPGVVSAARARGGPRYPHRPLGVAVWRALGVFGIRPRCLLLALVHHRLLRAQGDAAELVIGLPAEADGHRAHAWVEVDGIDVGPPPGAMDHVEIARYAGCV